MSVRAYRIKKIETEQEPTFNCWHDTDIFEIADSKWYDDGGYLTFYRDDVEIAIQELEETTINDKIGDKERKEKIEILKKIMKDIKANGDDLAEYLCY